MRLILVTGCLGTGKTTFVTNLLIHNARRGLPKPLLLVNDVGKFNVDRSRLEATGLADAIQDLTSGCLDCADRDAFMAALRGAIDADRDTVIEPTGAANGDNLHEIFEELAITPVIVTLLDVLHFRRNMAYDPKALKSQLRHATHIGLTWWGHLGTPSLADPALEPVTHVIGHYAPAAPVDFISEGGIPADLLDTLLTTPARPILRLGNLCGCGHNHGDGHHHHHGHDHSHSHDHLHGHVRTVALSDAANAGVLYDLCDGLRAYGLVRAKGSFGQSGKRFRFDYVQGTFNIKPCDITLNEANFISSQPIPDAAIAHILGGEAGDISPSLDDVIAAIRYGMDSAWEPLMENGDIREDCAGLFRAYHRSLQFPVPADLRDAAIVTYCDWYLRVAHILATRDWGSHPKLPQWCRRVGTHLTLLAVRHPDVLGAERVATVATLRMATMAMRGLAAFVADHVTFKVDPVETPADQLLVARFGIEHEGLQPETVRSAFEHVRNLHSSNTDWTAAWDGVLTQI